MALSAKALAANQQFLLFATHKFASMQPQVSPVYATGRTFTFNFPATAGMGKAIWLMGQVDVNVTLGTGGAVVLSPYAPENLFREIRVVLGNTIHQVHPYMFRLVDEMSNWAGRSLRSAEGQAALQLWTEGSPANAPLGQGSIGSRSYTVAAGDNIWTFALRIPLQLEEGDVTGLVPLGASSLGLTLEVDTEQTLLAANPAGEGLGTVSPLMAPVILSTASTTATSVVVGTACNNNLTAVLEYYGFDSFVGPQGAGVSVPVPTIGEAIYLRYDNTALASFGAPVFATFKQPYQFMKMITVIDDGFTGSGGGTVGAPDAAIAGNSANNRLITSFGLYYDQQNPALVWDAAKGGMAPYHFLNRRNYGRDFISGTLPIDFAAGTDPKRPNGQALLNLSEYSNAAIGLTYNNPGVTTYSPQIYLFGQYLVPVQY